MPQVKVMSEKQLNNNIICREKNCSYTIKWIIDKPQKIQLDVVSNNNGIFVISDTYYPGWNAYVDGKKTEHFPVNINQRGIFLPKGRHIVEYKYKPYSFMIGALISILSYSFLLIFLLVKVKLKSLKRLGD